MPPSIKHLMNYRVCAIYGFFDQTTCSEMHIMMYLLCQMQFWSVINVSTTVYTSSLKPTSVVKSPETDHFNVLKPLSCKKLNGTIVIYNNWIQNPNQSILPIVILFSNYHCVNRWLPVYRQ